MSLPWKRDRLSFSPYRLPDLQGSYSVDGSESDSTYLTNGLGRVRLIADRSKNSAENCFASSGAASNTATSPNVSTTGNQTFSFDVAFPDYTPSGDLTLVNKLSGNDGFQIVLVTTGVIRLRIGDGASVTNVDSTVGLAATDLSRVQFQAIWEDGVGATFTKNGAALGDPVAAAKTLSNAAVAITLWASTPGVAYSFTCGTYTFNPSGADKLASTFVAPTTGETWTINTSGDLGARISGARDLVQFTTTKMGLLSVGADGRNLLTFDGSNDYMKAAPFSLSQPETVYFVGSQVSWTINDLVMDGNATDSMRIQQRLSSPEIQHGTTAVTNTNAGWTVGTRAVLRSVYSGASSSLGVNRNVAAKGGDTGATSASGFTLASVGAATSSWSNITFNEAAIFSAAHPESIQLRVASFMGRKWAFAV